MTKEIRLIFICFAVIGSLLICMTLSYTHNKDEISRLNTHINQLNHNAQGLKLALHKEKVINSINVSDIWLIIQMCEAEATGANYIEKMLVAEVILNRVASDKFPNTVEEVIYQTNAFSPINDGRFGTLKITDSTIKGVQLALDGSDLSQGSLFFVQPVLADSQNYTWFTENLEYVMTSDLHEFWRYL